MSTVCPSGLSSKRAFPLPPPPLRHTHAYFRSPSSTHDLRSSKRRNPHWPKPPHYHGSLLRSPVSRRKGLFRMVLPPNKAVDFFRWDIILGGGVSNSTHSQEHDNMWSNDLSTLVSLHVAESVLAPYEAGVGFFGWHGLGLDVIRREHGKIHEDNNGEESYWSQGSEEGPPDHEDDESAGRGMKGSSLLQLEIDEMDVDEGRARWARMVEELVGPPGLVLPQFEQHSNSSFDPEHKDAGGTEPTPFLSRDEVRWDPEIGSSQVRPSRPLTRSVEHGRPSSAAAGPGPSSTSFKSKPKKDPPSAWWYGPQSHRGPPPPVNYPALRFAPPPPQFSPWYPGIRVGLVQGHGYWYGTPSNGTPSSSHTFASPALTRPGQSSHHHAKASLNEDDYGPGAEEDKETETDHGYESTATTTDSDPPPHTPTGASAAPHYGETSQVHGGDDLDMHGMEVDGGHVVASTPIKLQGRSHKSFSSATSPLHSTSSPVSSKDSYQTPDSAVVFPSLNGTFRQGSLSPPSASSMSEGMPTRPPPRSIAPAHSSASPAVDLATRLGVCPMNEVGSKMKLKAGSPEPRSSLHSSDSPAVTLSVCSPPPTSPSPGLRKDSQGFWEPVTPISPSSSLSSLPSEGSRPSAEWIGENTVQVLAVGSESTETSGPPLLSPSSSSKARSISPGPRHVVSAGSSSSSSSTPTSFSSTTSTSASSFGVMCPSSSSPPTNPVMLPPDPNPTTLLPAFLANNAVKKKKTSRTREIVDRLRSSSIDAGKDGVGPDGFGWLAGSNGDADPVICKPATSSETVAGDRAVREQLSPSSPSKSSVDSRSIQTKVQSQTLASKVNGGTTSAMVEKSESPLSAAHRPHATTNIAPAPFPILSVPSKPASGYQSQPRGTTGLESATSPSHGTDKSRMSGSTAISPSASSTGSRHPPGASATSSIHPPHPSLPSPSYPAVHGPPPLAPPPMIAVAPPYAHPVYMPFAQYQPAQSGWLAVYRPPALPVHPHSVQAPIPPITGASGMRHVSW